MSLVAVSPIATSTHLAERWPRCKRGNNRKGPAMATRQEATEHTRLTRDDIGRMVDRVSAVVKDWIEHPGATRAWIGGPATDETLTRIACHAIGCSAADLRDVELVTVAQVVDAATEHAKTLMAARVWAS